MNNTIRRLSLRFEARKLKKMSPVKQFDMVLEIGGGEGQGAKNILRLFKPTHLDSLDLDPKMIQRAKRRVHDRRATFSVGDASDLSFAQDNSYDAVFDFAIIHHIPNWQDCLKEVYRVLKPGGWFLIEDGSIESFTKKPIGRLFRRLFDHPYNQMYTKQEFETELDRIGFATRNQSYLRPYLMWKVLEKSS